MSERHCETSCGESSDVPKPGWLYPPKGSEAKDYLWVNPCFDGMARVRLSIPGEILEAIGIQNPVELRGICGDREASIERSDDHVQVEAMIRGDYEIRCQNIDYQMTSDIFVDLHNLIYRISERLNRVLNRKSDDVNVYKYTCQSSPFYLQVLNAQNQMLLNTYSDQLGSFFTKLNTLWEQKIEGKL